MILHKLRIHPLPRLLLGLLSVGGLAAVLRFWGLERFNDLVFDEVYFAKFANHYLTGTQFFDAHPPLGKYLIAVGIWLAQRFPGLPQTLQNDLTGAVLSTFSYRWMNAFIGSCIPLVMAGIAYQLSWRSPYRYTYALVAALLTTLDGLLLVESRYALINVYLVFFGLLSHWFALFALNSSMRWRSLWLLLSGMSLGATVSVKWNGLGFWLGLMGLWAIAQGQQILQRGAVGAVQASPVARLSRLSLWQVLLYWVITPLLIYSLIWIPHLQLTGMSFEQIHHEIFGYHQRVGTGAEVHPYCSAWYTWPLMLRPVAYFYERFTDVAALPDALGKGVLAQAGTAVYDVHAMGNPILWWLATAAIVLSLGQLFVKYGRSLGRWLMFRPPTDETSPQTGLGNTEYWVVNYLANWLPWMLVSRCVFLYHYMEAMMFALLAIAALISYWLQGQSWRRWAGVGMLVAIGAAFLFWLPLYLGLPLSPEALRWRWWLESWI